MGAIKLGVQLFTLREQCRDAQGLEETFRFLESIGCHVVQISAIGDIDPQCVAELVDKYRMEVCVTHKPYDRMKNDLDALINEHDLIHCDNIGIGCMPGSINGSAEGVTGFILKCNEIAAKMKARGKQLCYHNHACDFEVYDGKSTFQRFIDETEMHFIPDTYWLQVAGMTPADYLRKLAGRVEVVHFKDLSVNGNSPRFAPVGRGNLDLGACYRASREIGAQYIVVEQDDCYELAPYEAVRIGFEGLQRIAAENGD